MKIFHLKMGEMLMGKNNGNELIPIEITTESLRDRIYSIRGVEVMLSGDLAEIYGYETKDFNRQVTNNIKKFEGEEFMFQLTKEEWSDLRRKNSTSSWGGNRYPPRAFTEQGVYLLMTVLKGDLAIRQSRALVKAFKGMKDIFIENPLFLEKDGILQISMQVAENSNSIRRIEEKIGNDLVTKDDLTKVIESFSLPDKGIEYVIYAGQTIEADAAYADIYRKAKKKLFIVDNYIGPKTLLMLKSVSAGVDIIIFSDNSRNMLRLSELQAFQAEYPNVNLSFQKTGGKFHDRYIIVDYKTRSEKIYHCGASSKDAGNKITTISKADNKKLYYPMIEDLLLRPFLILR